MMRRREFIALLGGAAALAARGAGAAERANAGVSAYSQACPRTMHKVKPVW